MQPQATSPAIVLARAYASARYAVALDGVEIPFAVGVRPDAVEHAWPRSRYGFLTAWNPASEPRPDAENFAADRRLVDELIAMEIHHRLAWAADAEGRWREHGWLLGDVDESVLSELGRRFGQAGVLAWRAGHPVRLAMLLPRGSTDPGPAFTDWVE